MVFIISAARRICYLGTWKIFEMTGTSAGRALEYKSMGVWEYGSVGVIPILPYPHTSA
jgi:hypothetical protein